MACSLVCCICLSFSRFSPLMTRPVKDMVLVDCLSQKNTSVQDTQPDPLNYPGLEVTPLYLPLYICAILCYTWLVVWYVYICLSFVSFQSTDDQTSEGYDVASGLPLTDSNTSVQDTQPDPLNSPCLEVTLFYLPLYN